jgi:hypothetical protein
MQEDAIEDREMRELWLVWRTWWIKQELQFAQMMNGLAGR